MARRCIAEVRAAWHPGRLLLAVVLAGGCTLITYPGIFYTDSYARAARGAMIASGQALDTINTYLSIIPQFFIAACLELTSNFAAWTWLQATLLLWAIIEASFAFFRGRARYVVCALFMIDPLIIGYSVYWEMGVLAAACLLWLLLIERALARRAPPLPWPLRALLIPVYGFLIFAMVGARLNAGTAAVGLLLWDAARALRERRAWRELLAKAAAIVAGTVLAFALPRMLGMPDMSNGPVGLFWETQNMVNVIGPGQGYDDYLDGLLGPGGTQRVMETPLDQATSSIYGYGMAIGEMSAINKAQVHELYAKLLLARPDAFLQVKCRMIRNALGTLSFSEYDYDRDGAMEGYRFSDTVHRRFFHRLVVRYMEVNAWLRTPWLLFAAAALLAAAARLLAGTAGAAPGLLWMAACYYGAFFLNAQSFEFRYFFPACLLLLFSCLLSLQELQAPCRRALGRLFARRRP